jgi:hypothetical protein
VIAASWRSVKVWLDRYGRVPPHDVLTVNVSEAVEVCQTIPSTLIVASAVTTNRLVDAAEHVKDTIVPG